MGYDVGINGVWGIILDDALIGKDLMDRIRATFSLREGDEDPADQTGESGLPETDSEAEDLITERHLSEVADALKMAPLVATPGRKPIILPKGCCLFYTGNENDRAGRGGVDTELFVVGIGIMVEPWKWPKVHKSFKEAAHLQEWVWGG